MWEEKVDFLWEIFSSSIVHDKLSKYIMGK